MAAYPESSDRVRNVDYLVVGAGPTGLGACSRLQQKGADWLLIDAFDEAGGLACTDITPEGFLFDMGGHVIFSHYQYFDDLIDAAVGEGDKYWNTLQRISYVWMMQRWVPYPFQNNLYCLPRETQIECINGVIDATKESAANKSKPTNFDEWIMRVMGEGIANVFMRPYNFKVWAIPTHLMQCSWLGERVATVDAKKVIENVLKNEPAVGWGPNAVFRFPKEGGTGEIWKKVAALLPEDKQQYKTRVVKVDADNKTAILEDGSSIKYNKLMSTISLDFMMDWVGKPELAKGLKYSSTHVVGFGIRGVNPHDLKCWLYYPEDDCPFYRCTVFSHYADKNVPAPDRKLKTLRLADGSEPADSSEQSGPYWSLMFEVSESQYKPVDLEKIIEETFKGAINTELMKSTDEVVSVYHRRLERGYPTPCLDRDAAIAECLPHLKEKGIWSRGRFGSWKYEVGNQDHSCMLGVEAADNMMFGAAEMTLHYPDIVNKKKNADLRFDVNWENQPVASGA